MSEPMTNVEIEDVLSSIRRLVSEDLRAVRPRPAAETALPPPEGKLVLTPALRVPAPAVVPAPGGGGPQARDAGEGAPAGAGDDPGDASGDAADGGGVLSAWGRDLDDDLRAATGVAETDSPGAEEDASGAGPAPWRVPQSRLMGWSGAVEGPGLDGGGETGGDIAGTDGPADTPEAPVDLDASHPAAGDGGGRDDHLSDAASLERTIAELEAAVAGLDAGFEPDGSEAAVDYPKEAMDGFGETGDLDLDLDLDVDVDVDVDVDGAGTAPDAFAPDVVFAGGSGQAGADEDAILDEPVAGGLSQAAWSSGRSLRPLAPFSRAAGFGAASDPVADGTAVADTELGVEHEGTAVEDEADHSGDPEGDLASDLTAEMTSDLTAELTAGVTAGIGAGQGAFRARAGAPEPGAEEAPGAVPARGAGTDGAGFLWSDADWVAPAAPEGAEAATGWDEGTPSPAAESFAGETPTLAGDRSGAADAPGAGGSGPDAGTDPVLPHPSGKRERRLHFGAAPAGEAEAAEEPGPGSVPEPAPPRAGDAASESGDDAEAGRRRGPVIIRQPGEPVEPGGANLFGADPPQAPDPEALRELVADIIRLELQGALGERITRSVRRLVRREIHRILESRELE
ncbi:MAG: hypothetical protein ACKVPY_04155 [Paracoccaceae bacterium]